MLDFLEQLAPIQLVGSVSCRTDVEAMYVKRGYKTVRRDQITDHISKEHLARMDIDYGVMVRNPSNLPLPTSYGYGELE